MRYGKFFLTYVILLIAQVVLSNLLDFTQLVTLALLPAMILCLPKSLGTPICLGIAFVSGFLVDFFGSGVLGLTCAALLPVTLLKDIFLRITFDNDTYSRIEELSVRKLGFFRILTTSLMMTALFLLIYIWIDGAGTRPFLFNVGRFLLSTVANLLVSIVVIEVLLSQNDRY